MHDFSRCIGAIWTMCAEDGVLYVGLPLVIFEANLGIPQRCEDHPFCAAISEIASPSWHEGSSSCDEDIVQISTIVLCAFCLEVHPAVGSTCT